MKWTVSVWLDYTEAAAAIGVPVQVLDASQPPTRVVGEIEAATKGEAISKAYQLEGVTVENMIVEPAR